MIYGIINSVVRGNEDFVDIQIYNIENAFDGLWLEDCLNDVYDSVSPSMRDDKLALVYESNKKNMVAIKTAVGMTDRINIPNIVPQKLAKIKAEEHSLDKFCEKKKNIQKLAIYNIQNSRQRIT